MPRCVGLRINGNAWQQVGVEANAGLNAGLANHAERLKLAQIASNPVLLVQDAYPCQHCHAYFLQQSGAPNNRNIIVKVEGNHGNYSADHGLGLHGGVPVIIYYSAGAAAYVHVTPPRDPVPAAFNNIPDFADQNYY